MVGIHLLQVTTNNDGGINNMTTDDIVKALFDELGWKEGDDIEIKIAGCRTSGIHQTDDANPKWAPPFGDVRYNRDAQIVIENLSRRDFTKPEPLQQDTLLAEFYVGDGGQLYKKRELAELPEPSRVDAPRASKRTRLINWIRKTLSR